MRPPLHRELNIESFRAYYWLKKELQHFCREISASAGGSKEELTDRIDYYLRTGELKEPIRRVQLKNDQRKPLSLETIIGENHRCTQEVRAFFTAIIPTFHFSTHIQHYLKTNPTKTYNDVRLEWYAEKARKKNPLYRRDIPKQFEYNQFIRDYFADAHNKGKTRSDAIKAWTERKQQPGSNQYRKEEYDVQSDSF
ncbi:hypothetical protein JOC54_000051 [Alkalihalobacillus xiaoxiensis]|uniref:DUF6434 domain-containing protein n=1 Tax=Shouchella xiaoxiensis TaxID=766895 RepID=A0ABS2SPT6_9BACI|nr:DUF6434 domain-containing protein [Shouchella xiaoxiensis]MBM7836820.1 hypothetical protein [Shouchella xiaoxiensis]